MNRVADKNVSWKGSYENIWNRREEEEWEDLDWDGSYWKQSMANED
jgi:hypothetical protein